MIDAAKAHGPGHRDFDFLHGRWRVEHTYLTERLNGCETWREFSGTAKCWSILDGRGNADEITLDPWRAVGMTVRLWDDQSSRWWLNWTSTRVFRFEPPVVGAFEGHRGVFLGADHHEGRPITVRYTWVTGDPDAPTWAQAFSADGGRSWETNWHMQFIRQAAPA